MIHFITLTKSRALALSPGDASHMPIARGLNHELMKMGFVLGKPALERVATQPLDVLRAIHAQLVGGVREVMGDSGYEAIYPDFPEGVIARGEDKGVQAAVEAFWADGAWGEGAGPVVQEAFAREPSSLAVIGLIEPEAVDALFTDMLYANQPLSPFDKECVRDYIARGGDYEPRRVTFRETAAFVWALGLDDPGREELGPRYATDVLRTWAAYSGGDEGLKEPTRFTNPPRRLRRLLLEALERCDADDLEESLKQYREPWLRLLFMLHPMAPKNARRYPQVAAYADRLRNDPKSLQTYNGKVEAGLAAEDPEVLALLAKRPGAFMRRLDHTVRLFGVAAFEAWMGCGPRFEQLLNVYNHFHGRAEAQSGRGAVLAGQGASEVVTYEALAPLPREVVDAITTGALERMRAHTHEELAGKKVYIDPALYLMPFAKNNRASSLSLDGKPLGTVERYDAQETLRMYVHWEGSSDIDLSGFVITDDLEVIKVGWNARHASSDYMVYSGDNTGRSDKNAEYLDVNTAALPEGVAWIVVEARIYRGPESFAGYEGKVRAGWMSRKHPEANANWLPETVQRAVVLQSAARTAYLMAYHPRTQSVVYLDVAMGSSAVSGAADALKMMRYLDATITLPSADGPEVSWDNLRLGHALELLTDQRVGSPEAADVAFDDATTSERVGALIKGARPA